MWLKLIIYGLQLFCSCLLYNALRHRFCRFYTFQSCIEISLGNFCYLYNNWKYCSYLAVTHYSLQRIYQNVGCFWSVHLPGNMQCRKLCAYGPVWCSSMLEEYCAMKALGCVSMQICNMSDEMLQFIVALKKWLDPSVCII